MVLQPENPDAKKSVYLITIPHTNRKDLDAPDTFTHEQIREKILDACRNLLGYNNCNKPVDVIKMVVAMEPHSPTSSAAGRLHCHVALLAKDTFRFLTIKKTLRDRPRLETH